MDTKLVFRALLWSLAAFLTWNLFANMIWPPPRGPEQAATTEPQAPAGGEALGTSPATGETTTPVSSGQPPAAIGPALSGSGTDRPETFSLGSTAGYTESPFRMQLELDNRAASLHTATLSDFAQDVDKPDRYRLLEAVEGPDGAGLASFAFEGVTVDQNEIDLQELLWAGRREQRRGAEAVVFTTELADPDGKPVLGLTVEYALPEQPTELRRFDLGLTVSVANLDNQPHEVIATLRGPVGMQRAEPRMDSRAVTVANRVEGEIGETSQKFPSIAKSGRHEFRTGGGEEPFVWIAVENTFFVCIVAPQSSAPEEAAFALAEVRAVDLNSPPETADNVTVRLITAVRSIAPGASVTCPFDCYLGPVDRGGFAAASNQDYVSRNYRLLITRNYSWCTFGWLTEFMIAVLDLLVRVPPRNYGVAIIILVLVVRVLLHPITKKGQVNMMKMQKQMGKLAPKLEEIKKQYANDRTRLNQEMQKLYQAEGINPAGQMLTCLPMMLQMPIWVALYTSLSNNIAMRHQPFCLWINDLTGPDRLIDFGSQFHLPLLGAMTGPIGSLNILPILWAVSMYAQQKLMPKPKTPEGLKPAQADQAAQMQKMMPIMSIVFALLFYNAPSGLTLYIMASTLFGTIEQLLIRRHIKELEQAGVMETRVRAPRGPRGPLWWRRLKDQTVQQLRRIQKRADEAQKTRSKRS